MAIKPGPIVGKVCGVHLGNIKIHYQLSKTGPNGSLISNKALT